MPSVRRSTVPAELLPIAITTSVAEVFDITTAEGIDREPLATLLSVSVKPAAFEELADDEILVARHVADIAGTLAWRLSSDLTAFVWCPVVDDRFLADRETIERQLLGEMIRRADSANAWFAQCLLTPTSERQHDVMLANGFQHIALLRSLSWQPGEIRSPHKTDDSLTVHVYDPACDRHRLIDLLEATWVESLDCPILNGHRTGAEAVQSHDSGDTSLWRIFRTDDRDVGLVLMSKNDSGLSVDYTGVVPDVRGRRIGRQIIQYVLDVARSDGLAVQLSVDTANEPAVRIYESLGFETDRYLEVLGRFHPSRV